MNKYRVTNDDISEIENQIDRYIESFERIIFSYRDTKKIAQFAANAMYNLVMARIDETNDKTITISESADIMQNLLDMVNDEKYKPLIKFLGKI